MVLYSSSTYKDYVEARLSVRGARSGMKSDFAKAVQCQNAYVSQTLNGHQHFTLEQAERINRFFNHNEIESHFFMLLVQRDRAGTSELRRYYQKQLQVLNKEREQIKSRVPRRNKEISTEHVSLYYSSWVYAGIHMALTVPELQNEKSLELAFRLPPNIVSKILSDLQSMGLADKTKNGHWITTPTYLHLEKESPFLHQHFTNWRLKSLDTTLKMRAEDLQYSVIFSVSRNDFEKIREELLSMIQSVLAKVKSSPEEVLAVFNLDLFRPLDLK